MGPLVYRVTSKEQVLLDPERIRQEYQTVGTVALDIETTGLSPTQDKIAVVSLAAPARPPAVLRLPDGTLPPWLKDLLTRPTVTVVGHNLAAFDLPFLVAAGLRLSVFTRYVDTLVLEALCLTSGRRDLKKDLATTLKRRLGVVIDKTVDHAGWRNPDLTEDQVLYAANDVAYLLPLFEAQTRRLHELGLAEAADLETSLVPVTASMVHRGLPFRPHVLLEAVERHKSDAEATQRYLASTYGVTNLRSSVQVKRMFEERFGLPLKSTDADTLAMIAVSSGPQADVARMVETARQHAKLTMYDSRWVRSHVDPDGRVRSRYWQLGTDTGRYSSTDPNLQQIPRSLRHAVGYDPGSGRCLVAIDYQQIEVVIAAALFRDPDLLKAVGSDDVHTITASFMFGCSPSSVTPEQRRTAKAATFTALFAGGVPGIVRSARALGVDLSHRAAQEVLSRWYSAFPVVEARISALRKNLAVLNARGTPYKVTVPNGGPVRFLVGERMTASTVINTLVQGTAAVGLKRAMRKLWERFHPALVATVHDEVILDVEEDDATWTADEARETMERAMRSVVGLPVRTSVKIGPTWGTDPEPRSVHVDRRDP